MDGYQKQSLKHIRWPGVVTFRDILIDMRFPQLLVKVIVLYLSSSSPSILLNVDLMKRVFTIRDIRQGDPFSLYLSIVCTKKLSQLTEKEGRKGMWKLLRKQHSQDTNIQLDIIRYERKNKKESKVAHSIYVENPLTCR